MTLLKANDLLTNAIEQKGSSYNENINSACKKNMPEQAKIKLKWKTIQYLLENKKRKVISYKLTPSLLAQIEMLTNNLKELINEVKEEKKRVA